MALLKISEPVKDENQDAAIDVIVGIDLGTTNSLVGVVRDGKVDILADENGNDVIASIVEYDEEGRVVGVGSTKRGQTPFQKGSDPFFEVLSIKRLMGKGRDAFVEVGNKKIRPEEVSAEILKYLKLIAEENLKTEVKKAVITVPAYFDEAAKNATKLAAELAGLEVMRLVNEPTAAALAYGLENEAQGIYAVYDLGGGTFDVSILKMQKGVFKVIGVAGDNHLGGDDFDELLVEKLGVSKGEARKIKEELSFVKNVGGDRAGGAQVLRCSGAQDEIVINSSNLITRNDFESLILSNIARTLNLTTNLLDDLNLQPQQIKGVILVGGSTRIPLIRKKLAEIFGEEKILTNLDPDRVVAIGAAWQAYNLSGQGNNLLLDVVPLSLGVAMMGDIVDKVIMRNSTIPASVTKEFTTYADNQTGIKLHIVQGERELASDCRSLAEFEIKNIPAMKAGLARVAVTFKVDADGLLTVSAEEKITREKQEIVIKPSYGLDELEVKKMLLDSLEHSKNDMEKRLLAKLIVDAKKDIMILRDDLENFSNLIDVKEVEEIKKNIIWLEKLIIDKANRDSISNALESLEESAKNLVLAKVNKALNEKIAGKNVGEV